MLSMASLQHRHTVFRQRCLRIRALTRCYSRRRTGGVPMMGQTQPNLLLADDHGNGRGAVAWKYIPNGLDGAQRFLRLSGVRLAHPGEVLIVRVLPPPHTQRSELKAGCSPDFIDTWFLEPAVRTSQATRSAMMSESGPCCKRGRSSSMLRESPGPVRSAPRGRSLTSLNGRRIR